ncbi:MAG: MarR family transcriptional regulator [Myxococcota bacterium]|nr:MarR family transcriptional regulator [Myxococcota bacterium]MEC8423203.1 MarR family transcriptional regulator [Myxococcota bacterium]
MNEVPTRILRLDHYWPYQIAVLAERIARRTTRIVKAHGLNLSQWRVLAAVAERPGRTAAEVVRVTPMDKGIVSRATRGLLERGLLRREASQRDGRLSHLFLTEPGIRGYEVLAPQVEALTQGVSDTIDAAEQDRLTTTLRALVQGFPDRP